MNPKLWAFPKTEISRRKFLQSSATTAVCVLMGCNHQIDRKYLDHDSEHVSCTISRFMMKKDYPRLEVQAPDYRFVWHGRWFGFRLCGRPKQFDERISYTSFGSFQVGSIDLNCAHLYRVPFKHKQSNLGLGSGRLMLPKKLDSQYPQFLLEYPGKARIYLRFSAAVPHIQMTFEPLDGKADTHYTVPFSGHGIFSETWQGKTAAAYFAPGAKTGLCVAGSAPQDVTVETNPDALISTINCRVPAQRPSTWALTVLGEQTWPIQDYQAHAKVTSQPTAQKSAFRHVQVSKLHPWEKQKMAERNWHAPRGIVQDRVAGIFITAPKWNHPLSKAPHGQIEHVEKFFLDKVIDTSAFKAIGLSRDGVYEQRAKFDTHARWLKLVERIHAAGLKAYMKPGDGELYRVRSRRDTLAQWVRDCFDVPRNQQVDVLRLCWEAVLHPWNTVNLCLPHLSEWLQKPKQLSNLTWPQVHDRIVTAVADKFSFIIDHVQKYSPKTTIDLECGDTSVFSKLLNRHENLGVMYMCYGQYPRVGDYLDLYACVARQQLSARRVVLETDCYYTYDYPSLHTLYRKPAEEMYPPADVENIAAKHRHMNALDLQAAWAWGINVCYTQKKFQAICQASSVPA